MEHPRTDDIKQHEDTELHSASDRPVSNANGLHAERLPRSRWNAYFTRVFCSLRHHNFRYLWFSTLFSSAGNWIQHVTLGWLTYDLTGSAFLVGSLHGVRSLPFMAVGPVGGVVADRIDRCKLLLGTHLFLAVLALGFAMLVVSGYLQVWHVFAFTFLSGCGFSFSNPIRQALVAETVPRDDLMNAISLHSVAWNFNRVLGPALGGMLIVFFGAGTNFFIQAICYVGVFIMVLPIQLHHTRAAVPLETPVASLVAGVRYVVKDETILALILLALVPSLFVMPFTSGLMPVFAEEVLHAGPNGLGVLLASFGLGAMSGTLALASLGTIHRKGRVLFVTAIMAGVGMVLFSQTRWLPLSVLSLTVVGAAHMIYRVTTNTILQTITPNEYRGRVMSIYLLDHALVPLGSFLAGSLAELFGSPKAILIGGVVDAVLILVVFLHFKSIRRISV